MSNVDRLSIYYYWQHIQVACLLSNSAFWFDLAHFKGESQGQGNFDCEYLVNVTNIDIANTLEVAFCLSVGVCTFDLNPF